MLGVALGTECQCDGERGYTCGKHERIRLLRLVLGERDADPLSNGERG